MMYLFVSNSHYMWKYTDANTYIFLHKVGWPCDSAKARRRFYMSCAFRFCCCHVFGCSPKEGRRWFGLPMQNARQQCKRRSLAQDKGTSISAELPEADAVFAMAGRRALPIRRRRHNKHELPVWRTPSCRAHREGYGPRAGNIFLCNILSDAMQHEDMCMQQRAITYVCY